jgi:Trk K+ transport system NAD-binding subunit
MKSFTSHLTAIVGHVPGQRNLRLLVRFAALLVALIVIFTAAFHAIMLYEGRTYSWISGLYWTFTVMSTLGFGDITFQSDLGRLFSILVMVSGMIFLLVLLPFTFIEFFYAPWMQAQSEARAPRQLPAGMSGHVLLTSDDPVSGSLIRKLKDYGHPYAILVADLREALRLHDLGMTVMLGELDRPETYLAARVEQAAMVAATGGDYANTNVAFTASEITKAVPIIATANSADSVDILQFAGARSVLQLSEMMGEALARRIVGADATSHVIGSFKNVQIAEATAAGTPLVGRTLAECRLRDKVGVNVLGLWRRGVVEIATAQTKIDDHSILLLAGTPEQFARYDELFCIYHVSGAPVIIVGGGRVGRETARALEERGVDYRIIEQNPARIRDTGKYVLGSAADIVTLERAGIRETPAVVITAHDDDLNIYLTIYVRRLCPRVQIISRSVHERNVPTLHRAGADFVLSYAWMGATAIFNFLQRADVLMLAEGLHVTETQVPPALAGKTLAEAAIPAATGVGVVALGAPEKGLQINPHADTTLRGGEPLILICTPESEQRFVELYGRTIPKHPPSQRTTALR